MPDLGQNGPAGPDRVLLSGRRHILRYCNNGRLHRGRQPACAHVCNATRPNAGQTAACAADDHVLRGGLRPDQRKVARHCRCCHKLLAFPKLRTKQH